MTLLEVNETIQNLNSSHVLHEVLVRYNNNKFLQVVKIFIHISCITFCYVFVKTCTDLIKLLAFHLILTLISSSLNYNWKVTDSIFLLHARSTCGLRIYRQIYLHTYFFTFVLLLPCKLSLLSRQKAVVATQCSSVRSI